MQKRDGRSTLEEVLVEKQELIRDYQTRAEHIDDAEVHRMLKHFAEAEAKQAVEIKEALRQMT